MPLYIKLDVDYKGRISLATATCWTTVNTAASIIHEATPSQALRALAARIATQLKKENSK